MLENDRTGSTLGRPQTTTLMVPWVHFSTYLETERSDSSDLQVTNVTDPEFRCYELDLQNTAGSTQTVTVSAGSQIGFKGMITRSLFYHIGD